MVETISNRGQKLEQYGVELDDLILSISNRGQKQPLTNHSANQTDETISNRGQKRSTLEAYARCNHLQSQIEDRNQERVNDNDEI